METRSAGLFPSWVPDARAALLHSPRFRPLAEVIVAPLDRWRQNLPPDLAPRLPAGPDDPSQHLRSLINDFVHQNCVGWGHFLRGRLSLRWKLRTGKCHKVRQPGDECNPEPKGRFPALDRGASISCFSRGGHDSLRDFVEKARCLGLRAPTAMTGLLSESAKRLTTEDNARHAPCIFADTEMIEGA